MMKKVDIHPKSAGFTLVEIGIIVPILIVTVLILFDALFAMIRASSVERGKIDLAYDAQNAITNIESDAVLASMYLPAVDTGITADPYKPSSNGGSWSYLGDSAASRVLIVRLFSTTANPLSSDRQPAFIGNPAGAECNATNIYFNDVQQYNAIYFLKNGNLYRRKVIDKTTSLCNPGQYQKFSCPSQEDLTAQGLGTRNATCQADDELLASNVTNFTVQYYGSKLGNTPLDVYAGGADPNLVTTAADAEISMTLSRTVSGETISKTSSLRMSKLNAKIEE
mgnify:CR=1 FL=1